MLFSAMIDLSKRIEGQGRNSFFPMDLTILQYGTVHKRFMSITYQQFREKERKVWLVLQQNIMTLRQN